ncbi:hypothetical protein AVEN_31847-1 [Araneus ventricosus]|uniref:Uncharacterized protein n=1 Tax=Araneus ventricosus TaxID=182803 RepID=A0A4Y2L5I4_ARAVE|nr:hypothetical protein AVEN_31847-1 [Araneus ventricosus]
MHLKAERHASHSQADEKIIFMTMGKKQTHIEPLTIACQSPMLWNTSWFADLTLLVRRRFAENDEVHTRIRKPRIAPFVFDEKLTVFGSP